MELLPALTRKLNFEFRDINLLKLALTHRSKGSVNYERLEFLGDSILGFVVAEWLYENFPDVTEGQLSRMRSSLVRKETLAEIARKLEISKYLILGEGELKSGGFNRDSILSDTIESLIGAIYLDSNLVAATEFIYSHFAKHFDGISERQNFKDYKSRLQETMQKQGFDLPVYKIIKTEGEQHNQYFTVECVLVESKISSQSTAQSRRLAEQQAAEKVLNEYLVDPNSGKNKRNTSD